MQIRSFFKSLLVVTLLSGSFGSLVRAEITISPEEPTANTPVVFVLEKVEQKPSTCIKWHIVSLDGNAEPSSKEQAADAVIHKDRFETPGQYWVIAEFETPKDGVLKERIDVTIKADTSQVATLVGPGSAPTPDPAPSSANSNTVESTELEANSANVSGVVSNLELELGLEHYVRKIVKQDQTMIDRLGAVTTGLREAYIVLEEHFDSMAENAPTVGLSENSADKQQALKFLDSVFEKGLQSLLKKNPGWRISPFGPDNLHPGERAFRYLFEVMKNDLKERLYNTSSEYRRIFTWRRAMEQLADGFKKAEEDFTGFIEAYKATNQSVYNNYLNKYGNGDDHNIYLGPKCPWWIMLGLF